MSRYPVKGDAARLIHSHAVQLNGIRVQRPRNSHVKTLNFEKEGPITMDRFFSPALVTIDPKDSGQVVEYKRIIAVAGWLNVGEIDISWETNGSYFFENHHISGGLNYQELDDPFVISNESTMGQFIRPELLEEPPFPAFNFTGMVIIETSPI